MAFDRSSQPQPQKCCRPTLIVSLITPTAAQVRDVVEPSMKPGDSTLVLLGALAPLMRTLKPNQSELPVASAALWALYVGACCFGCGGAAFSCHGTLPMRPPSLCLQTH